VAVHSFDHRIPVAVRARRPGTAIGLLMASYPLDIGAVLRPAAAESLWQQAQLIDAALVREAHAAGATVVAWTVNDTEQALTLAALGVDALCTDTPGLLRVALQT
jgi:glycerophosphoryl diester phosphodiesterase